jgi:hypothetical protein
MPNLLGNGSYPPGTAGRDPGYNPMNDDVTIVPASLRASAKIDFRLLNWSTPCGLRQGISLMATALNRNMT